MGSRNLLFETIKLPILWASFAIFTAGIPAQTRVSQWHDLKELYNLDGTALQKLADAGDANAQYLIALDYRGGNLGFPKDYAQAAEWFRKAAELGQITAQNDLALCYRLGEGVSKDNAAAFTWYMKAAQQGDAQAENSIGTFYFQGLSVAKNYSAAMTWFRKAADQGNAGAEANVAALYKSGWGVPQDLSAARNWYQRAADHGDANAKAQLAALPKSKPVAASAATTNDAAGAIASAAPAAGASPEEPTLDETIDFIRRKLAEPQENVTHMVCDNGSRPPISHFTHSLLRATALELHGPEIRIDWSGESGISDNEKEIGGNATPVILEQKFRLDELDVESVAVAPPDKSVWGSCTTQDSAWKLTVRTKPGAHEHNVSSEILSTQDCAALRAEYATHDDAISCDAQGHRTLDSTKVTFAFSDKQLAARVAKALIHAIVLTTPNAKPDVF